MAVMRARVAAATLLLLASAACSGGGEEPGGDGTPEASQSARAAEAERIEPVWLVRSVGTRESTTYDAWTQTLFVDGDIAVYAVYDSVLGVSLKDGKTVWSTPVDFHGEVPDQMGTAATEDHHWHVSGHQPYEAGEDKYGYRLYTIDVRDGTIVNDVEAPGVGADTITSIDGTDYLTEDGDLYRILPSGELELIWSVPPRLEEQVTTIDQVVPVAGTSRVTLRARTGRDDVPTFFGFDTATDTLLWTRAARDIAQKPGGLLSVMGISADGRYITQRVYTGDVEWVHLWVIDPATGATRGHQRLQAGAINTTPEHRYMFWYQNIDAGAQHLVTAVGDDLITRDGRTIVRYRPLTGEVVWQYPYEESWSIGPLTPDGRYLFANAPDPTTGSILLIDAEKGTKAAGWSVSVDHAEGLLSSPLIVPTEDGLVLGRNQSFAGNTTDDVTPTEKLNDLGFFAYRY